jgi:MFS family permease
LGLTAGPIMGILVSKVWSGNQAFLLYACLCLCGAATLSGLARETGQAESAEESRLHCQEIVLLVTDRGNLSVLVAIMLYGAGYGLLLTVIPGYLIAQKSFGRVEVGIFFTLFYFAISLSQLFAGALADRRRERIFMVAGLVLAAFGMGTFTMIRQPLITILLTMASAGLGLFFLSSMTYLNGCVSDSMKGTVSGAFFLFWGVGYFAGPLAVGELGKHAGFAVCFAGFSLLFAANALAIVLSQKRRTG